MDRGEEGYTYILGEDGRVDALSFDDVVRVDPAVPEHVLELQQLVVPKIRVRLWGTVVFLRCRNCVYSQRVAIARAEMCGSSPEAVSEVVNATMYERI